MEQRSYPVANTIEAVVFSLAALASRDGPILDTKDWSLGELGQFTDTRKSGWPFLEGAILPPGNVNVIIRLGTTAGVFSDWLTIAAPAGAWTPIREAGFQAVRIPARFCRVRVTDTSNAANNGIDLWTRVASQ